jgi:hypothetical protein
MKLKYFLKNIIIFLQTIQIFNDYTKYRSIKLKKLFNSDKTNAIIILMLIYIYMNKDKNKNISLIFKFILDKILFKSQYQYIERINKTVYLFMLVMLAKYFTKIFVLSKEDSAENFLNQLNIFVVIVN